MPERGVQDIAGKILTPPFTRNAPDVPAVTDPIADTPMIVTLDQLEPCDLNPRLTRNPCYDEIKASIHERGLDAPPPITRRPGMPCYMIRNGGNTRLAILRELWGETRDEKFFRIACLFRPWPARGDILVLTGHLAENDLRGELSFIERALGIEKARQLYEQEIGKPLSQRELARRLATDGYPIALSLVNRMQDTVRYLLPAIPSVLYAGLGRPQIERLIALRKAAARCWDRHASTQSLPTDFPTVFQDVLALFETDPKMFHVQRVQDELLGKLSNVLKVPYGTLTLDIVNEAIQQGAWIHESSQRTLPEANTPVPEMSSVEWFPASIKRKAPSSTSPVRTSLATPAQAQDEADFGETPSEDFTEEDSTPLTDLSDRVRAHVVSPAETTPRLRAVQKTIAEATGESLPDFESNVLRAIPVQAGGLHPISDVWYIEPSLDVPERLRTHIAQLAAEIAQEAKLAERIEPRSDGIGYVCAFSNHNEPLGSAFQRGVWTLLQSASALYFPSRRANGEPSGTLDEIALVLQGRPPSRQGSTPSDRLSDESLVKYFRLIRLARRLLELEGHPPSMREPRAR